jgi:hypothetical protein
LASLPGLTPHLLASLQYVKLVLSTSDPEYLSYPKTSLQLLGSLQYLTLVLSSSGPDIFILPPG